MRILVLGAGGIGGYFGGRLAERGADVTFLVRDKRAELLRGGGLRIESPFGDATIDAKTATTSTLNGHHDLILLGCKAYDLDTAIAAIAPAVGPRTTILPLLNGLAHMDRLDETFGAERVVGGVAHISVTLAPDGTIRHLNKLHTLTYGPREAGQAARCDAVGKLLDGARFEVRRSDKIMQDMWEKFAFITAASAITCLMRAPIGAIVAADEGERMIAKMLDECDAVAAAEGYPARAKAKEWARPFLTAKGSDFKASMLRDLEAGAKVEADHLQGDMIRRGAAKGVATNLLDVAYCQLQAYQAERRS